MKIVLRICIFLVLICEFNLFIAQEERNYDRSPEKLVFRHTAQKLNDEEVDEEKGDVNVKKKFKIITQMVNEAVSYFKKNTFEQSCRDFVHNLRWRKGEIFPFVFDIDGNIYAHGDSSNLIWKNLFDLKKFTKIEFQELIEVSKKGGWVHYKWNNGFKSSYMVQVEKDNVKYIIGAGFFPESKEYDVVRIVEDAVRLFKIAGKEEAFTRINNTSGIFVKGDISAFAYDLQGNAFAHGEYPARVGQNFLNLKDDNGIPVTQEFIKIAKSKEGKGWFEYVFRRDKKRTYISRVVDPKTKVTYYIGAGYFPNITLDSVYSFVARAIRHLKDVGAKQAFADFSNTIGEYIRGPLTVFVYDLDGVNLANGENPEFVGQSLLNMKDPEGLPFVKKIISIAQKNGRGTLNYIHKNATKLVYFELVDVPDGRFIIGSGYYPDSKPQSVRSLINRGVDFLKNNSEIEAFKLFGNNESEFFHGDLYLFVYGTNGTTFVNGMQNNMIWQNYLKVRDERGKLLVENIISLANAGGGWLTYYSRNALRRVYVHLLEKENKQLKQKEFFVIGSGYYL